MKRISRVVVACVLTVTLAACETARVPFSATSGLEPTILPPNRALIPTINIAPALGWPAGAKPVSASGTTVTAFVSGLDHPRWVYVLPNGDVLVAETNAPERPAEHKGIKGRVMKQVQKRAGAGVPSANRITLLRDADGDGVAETRHVFLEGLNSPFGMALVGSDLYIAERDELGSDVPPDYLTSVRDGGFYGWPYSYFGTHLDPRVKPQRPDLVAKALVPAFALGPHVAPLGLVWSQSNSLPAAFHNGMFVGQHGSWNRNPPSGYNVVFVSFSNGRPSGQPIEVLHGFVSPEGKAYGRPVGVAIDNRGGLLVADDVGNIVWRVTAAR